MSYSVAFSELVRLLKLLGMFVFVLFSITVPLQLARDRAAETVV